MSDNTVLAGATNLRPWRVAPLVDVHDAQQVHQAFELLSDVWGGFFTPILDSNATPAELRSAVAMFDVDSVWPLEETYQVPDELKGAGIWWRGAGAWGPFSDQGGFRNGIMRASVVEGLEAPPARFALRRAWGYGLASEAILGSGGQIEDTRRGLLMSLSYVDPLPTGLAIIRLDRPADVVAYWNYRSLGAGILPFTAQDSDLNREVLDLLEQQGVPHLPVPDGQPVEESILDLWGASDLEPAGRAQISEWAERTSIRTHELDRSPALRGVWFSGFQRIAEQTFRVETRRGELNVSLPAPRLPLPMGDQLFPGIVAAEIHLRQATGLDPRLTVCLPAYRSSATLLGHASAFDQARTSRSGPVLGVHAHTTELQLPIPFNLEVFRSLFAEEEIELDQSDEGKFQSRVSEMFGGSTALTLTQPGLRAAIEVVSERGAVTLQEIQGVIQRERGAWPNTLDAYASSPKEYADRTARVLLSSGLLIPLLDVQCTYCRVVSRVTANDLGTTVRCEFCQEDFSLAFALALKKPNWRFRLAAHLASTKVKAVLPALSALSVLASMDHFDSTPQPHVLGLEIQRRGQRKVEVDVAAVLRHDDWTTVLVEVKYGNRIDSNDIEGLFDLRDALLDNGRPCVVMLATLKSGFGAEEVEAIRETVERRTRWLDRRHDRVPTLPLLLTKHDMSLPYFDDEHPWRWSQPGSGQGIFGIARESMRRHVGLVSLEEDPRSFDWTTGALPFESAQQASRKTPPAAGLAAIA